jgi:hypothetical protein
LKIITKRFRRPISITSSKEDDIYCLCDGLERFIKIFKTNGQTKSINIFELGLSSAFSLTFNKNNELIILDYKNRSLNWFDVNLELKKNIKIPGKKYGTVYYDEILDSIYISVIDKFKIIKIDNKLSILDFYNYSKLENCFSVNGICIKNNKLFLIDSQSSQMFVISNHKTKCKKYLQYGRDGRGKVRNPTSINFINGEFFINDNKNYLIQWFDSNMNFIDQVGGKGTSHGKFDLPVSSIVFKNNLLICDKNNDRIISLNPKNKKCETLIKSKFLQGELRRPSGMAIDNNDNIYISDRSNNVIQVFDINLKFIKVLQFKNMIFERPSSLAIIDNYLAVIERKSTGSSLNLFKLNIKNFSLELLENFKFEFKLNDPQDMCSTNRNSILIADTLNRKIIEVNLEGKIINEVDMSVISNNKRVLIKTVFCREDGHLFTADFDGCIIFHFNKKLELVEKINISSLINEIKVIRAVFATKDYLIIGVRGKNQVLKINFKGEVLEKINSFKWNHPVKIINDNKGNIIIADKENDRIVKV